MIERARKAKVSILDRRMDVPEGKRDFPAYLDSNRFLSNLPGTTVLLPRRRPLATVHQWHDVYADPARGAPADHRRRPQFLSARRRKKWVKNGFLNKDIKIPLGTIATLRTQIEADLLLQNLLLVADAMGLGGLDPRLD